jgi:hypothetical protein
MLFAYLKFASFSIKAFFAVVLGLALLMGGCLFIVTR